MKLNNLKIETQLKIGAIIVLSLVVTLGVISWIQADKLERQTINLYEHPLTVRSSLGEFRNDVLQMQLCLNDIARTPKNTEKATNRQKLELCKNHAYKQLNVLGDRYLGSKSDVDALNDAFVEWNTMNEETLRLFFDGKTSEAMDRIASNGVGGKQLEILTANIQKIEDFAKNKSIQFFLDSTRVKHQLNRQLIYSVLIILLIISALIIFLIRNISTPLAELNSVIRLFKDGKINERIHKKQNNEFGILFDSFNELADKTQDLLELNEKAIKLDSLMLSEEDAHRFCHKLLGALLQDTWSQMGAVYLLNDEKTKFEYFECIGMLGAGCKPFSATKYEGEFGLALATRKIQHITCIPEDSRFTFATVTGEFLPREIITIPVLTGNEVVAVIALAKIKEYSSGSLKLLDMIQGTLNARVGGILANRKILAFSQKLEYQNIELESQKNELSAQTHELTEQNMELEMQKKQLDESNKLKTSFLSNMSHELRTPLNSVIALSGVLNRRLSGKVPEEEYSYLEVIERNGKNLLSLINDILDLSRIEAGREEVEITTFNVRDLIVEIIEMIDPQAKLKNIGLHYLSNEDLGVKSDYDKLRHILQNLIGNAVKFTEEGSVEVTTQLFEKHLCINVTDTGIGIKEEHLSDIFDEFKQADGSNSRKYGGTGLGLSIAKKYAEILGGHIDVLSTHGNGSQFMLTLPLSFAGQLEMEVLTQPVYLPEICRPDDAMEKINNVGKTILIVEDTNAVVIQMKDMLEMQGYNLLVAHNGSEAIEQIARKVPDGMILDLMMPEVDGFEVLKCVREEKMSENLPIIILTAKYVTKEELSFLKSNGIHQLIHKGDINKEQLLKSVSSMFSHETEYKKQPERSPLPTTGIPVVLVVEDNPDNMLTIRALLGEKCKVMEAENGNVGIQKAHQYHPNLILMDIALPGINGIEVLKELRKDIDLNLTPIIAVSANAMKGDRERFISYGFDEYISKPIDALLFSKIVGKWIE